MSLSKYLSVWNTNQFFCSLLLLEPCPHQSVPVEMDESMTSSSLELAWPLSCKQCEHAETSKSPQEHGFDQPSGSAQKVGQSTLDEKKYHHEHGASGHETPRPPFVPSTHPGQDKPHPASVWPRGLREQVPLHGQDFWVNHQGGGFVRPSDYPQNRSVEEAESLEPPFSLVSVETPHYIPSRHPEARVPGQCLCCIRNTKYYR